MKTATISSAALLGLDCRRVHVEADVAAGMHGMTVVGLPDNAVQEAKERVRSALKNAGFQLPRAHCVINLAPADVRKEGTAFDLPIALALLVASRQLTLVPAAEKLWFVGELSLEGKLRAVPGMIALALAAQAAGVAGLIVPQANAAEAALIPDLCVLPADDLRDVVAHCNGEKELSAYQAPPLPELPPDPTFVDLGLIRGHEQAKRALEIAAAGGHNLLLSGPPGSGKTLLARSLTSILPPLQPHEALGVSKVYSVAGLLSPERPLIRQRPLRTPHHSASLASIIGGGHFPKPGEVSLAHHGVLFLDELPEFPRQVLEALRQPIEDGVVTVARVHGTVDYPASFMLIATQNPCPCGFAGDPDKECSCTPQQLINYHKKLSGPLLDRIDMFLTVPRLPFEKLAAKDETTASVTVRERVTAAREKQTARFHKNGITCNSRMTVRDVHAFCKVDAASEQLLKTAVNQLHLSGRAYHRVLKLARTIADLENAEQISADHVAEALGYRERGNS